MSRNTETGSTRDWRPTADKKIYLTGFMGSGKSTVGPILAEGLGCSFCDLDSKIEAAAGLAIPEIFSRYGEPEFRRMESEALGSESDGGREVIALGGGAVLDPGNMALIRRTGVLIYLKVPTGILIQRVKDEDHRPLLNTGASETSEREKALRERIETMKRTREPVYLQADYTVDAGDRNPEDCAGEILKFLGEKNG